MFSIGFGLAGVVKQWSYNTVNPSSTPHRTSYAIPEAFCNKQRFRLKEHSKWVRRYDTTWL